MPKLRIAVIGSGPAGAAALMGIHSKAPDAEVWLFTLDSSPSVDTQKVPSSLEEIREFYSNSYKKLKQKTGLKFPPVKSHFGTTLPQYTIDGRPRFFKSNSFGGLSNYWGGTMLPFTDQELENFPYSAKDLKPYYAKISQAVGISGASDGLSEYFDEEFLTRPALRLPKKIESLSASVNGKNSKGYVFLSGRNRIALETRNNSAKTCVYCGECMGGCFKGAIYSAATTIAEMSSVLNLKIVRGEVLSVDERTQKITYRTQQSEESLQNFDKIFVCAGCPATTEIVMRSAGLREGPELVDNVIYQFPILDLRSSPKESSEYFSLSNIVWLVKQPEKGSPPLQVQLYPNFDYLWRNAMPESLWPILAGLGPVLRNRILWARVYYHSDVSYRYGTQMSDDNQIQFKLLQSPSSDLAVNFVKSVTKLLSPLGYWIPPVKPIAAKTSSHLAGTLASNTDGRLGACCEGKIFKDVYICDSSFFPNSPAVSLTFTIMAHSLKVVTEALS